MSAHRCTATTKAGKRCRRTVPAGELLCGTHAALLTAADVAERYGISTRTVRSWVREGLPTARQGRQGGRGPLFDCKAADAWIERRTRQDEMLSSALSRKIDAQSAREHRVLEQLARDLLPADEVDAGWAATCRAVRDRLNRVPRELAPEIMDVTEAGPAAVAALMDAHVRQVLRELADPALYNEVEQSANPVPRPGPLRKSETVREARAQLATLQALVLETRNRVGVYELRRRGSP